MYAVVTTGGKQYRVEPGSELEVERLSGDAGSSVTFDRVLLVGDGEAVTIGTPIVEGATVSGTVLGEALGPKLIIFKFKQKATYRRKNGHRQHLTRIRIDEINASGKTAKADKAPKAKAAPEPEPAAEAESTATAESAPTEKPKRTRKTAEKSASADASDATEATATEKPKRTRKPATKKTAEE